MSSRQKDAEVLKIKILCTVLYKCKNQRPTIVFKYSFSPYAFICLIVKYFEMDDDDVVLVVVLACVAAVHLLLTWQFLELAEQVKQLILGQGQKTNGRTPKVHRKSIQIDHFHQVRFYFR